MLVATRFQCQSLLNLFVSQQQRTLSKAMESLWRNLNIHADSTDIVSEGRNLQEKLRTICQQQLLLALLRIFSWFVLPPSIQRPHVEGVFLAERAQGQCWSLPPSTKIQLVYSTLFSLWLNTSQLTQYVGFRPLLGIHVFCINFRGRNTDPLPDSIRVLSYDNFPSIPYTHPRTHTHMFFILRKWMVGNNGNQIMWFLQKVFCLRVDNSFQILVTANSSRSVDKGPRETLPMFSGMVLGNSPNLCLERRSLWEQKLAEKRAKKVRRKETWA